MKRADTMILQRLCETHGVQPKPLAESVTISTDHESEKACILCDGRGHHKDDPDYGEMPWEQTHKDGPHGAKTCYACAGVGTSKQSTAEVNMANANAHEVLKTIGITKGASAAFGFEGYSSGRWEPHELPEIHRRITKALNVKSRRKGAGRAPLDVGGPGTGHARAIDHGIDDDYVKDRLQQVGHVVHTAIKHGGGVSWG